MAVQFWRMGLDRSGHSCATCGCTTAISCVGCTGGAPKQMQVTFANNSCTGLNVTVLADWIDGTTAQSHGMPSTYCAYYYYPIVAASKNWSVCLYIQTGGFAILNVSQGPNAGNGGQYADQGGTSTNDPDCLGYSNRDVPYSTETPVGAFNPCEFAFSTCKLTAVN